MDRTIQIVKKYLWFPIYTGAKQTVIELWSQGEKVAEFKIGVPEDGIPEPDYWAPFLAEKWRGSDLHAKGDVPAALWEQIRQEDARPKREGVHPQLHFTPDAGWINDPNGLVFHGGWYHLYFQYNPYDTSWNDCHWGHAVSRDLLHWEQKDTVLYPDGDGTVYSGCGLVDRRNEWGLGQDALLFFYTSAGGENRWSQGKPYTQCMAYSVDGGNTLQREPAMRIPNYAKGNRDPKVFYHEDSKAYCMALYFDGNRFGIFRSPDLHTWQLSQEITLETAWECPDLFPLPVEGEDREKWVFWSADGFYFVGDFDGYGFYPQQVKKSAYLGTVPYAAQTYWGTGERRISLAWLRTRPQQKRYTGAMSLPHDLCLCRRDGEYRLRLIPSEEIEASLQPAETYEFTSSGVLLRQGEEFAWQIKLRWRPGAVGATELKVGEALIRFDVNEKEAMVGEERFAFSEQEGVRLIVDGNILELSADHDLIYLAAEIAQDMEPVGVRIQTDPACPVNIELRRSKTHGKEDGIDNGNP